jgi:sterol O-acyltransferase
MAATAHARAVDGSIRHRKIGSLAEALRSAGHPAEEHSPRSETLSEEEDYDENVRPQLTQATRLGEQGVKTEVNDSAKSVIARTITRNDSGIHIPSEDGKSLQRVLQQSSQRMKEKNKHQHSRKFRDLVFTHKLSAFDPNNQEAANSPFHGFYNLFWIAVALFVCKISANNWRTYGDILGPSDILKTMFSRDGKLGT